MPLYGKIKFFNEAKGFGFITLADGQEIFFHASAIKGDEEAVQKGRVVTLLLKEDRRGLHATAVTPLTLADADESNWTEFIREEHRSNTNRREKFLAELDKGKKANG